MDSLLGLIDVVFPKRDRSIDLDVAVEDPTRTLLVSLHVDDIAGFEIVRPAGEQFLSG